MTAPIAAVIGSTGTQGKSVVLALSSSGYSVRALTRSLSTASTTFSHLSNVTPTYFDIADRSTVEAAFEGAEVVFAMTFPDRKSFASVAGTYVKPEGFVDEEGQGKVLVDVAKEKGVKVFVYSTVDEKAGSSEDSPFVPRLKVHKYLKKVGLPHVKLALAVFNENLLNFGWIKTNEAGDVVYRIPYAKPHSAWAHISVAHDMGGIVAILVKNFEKAKLDGELITLADHCYTLHEALDSIAKGTGRKVILDSPDTFGVPGSYIDLGYKRMGETPYLAADTVPDKVLVDLGFKFQNLEEFVREKVLPTLPPISS